MLRRVLTIGGTTLFVVLALALYREWVIRNAPLLYLPLGFSERAIPVTSPEELAQNPVSWIDPLRPAVLDAADFDALAVGADMRDADALVTGGTVAAIAAASSAAEDGLDVALTYAGDWKALMATEAAEYVARDLASDSYESGIEWDMRRSFMGSGMASPSRVAALLTSMVENNPRIALFAGMDVQSFGRGPTGRIDRALLRGKATAKPIVVRFDYLIDATHDGSALALADAGTRSSWDAMDDEKIPQTPSAAALEGLAAGYTMSGRTIPGIGKRLEGGHAYIAVLDRGFNGWFVPTKMHDGCWAKDPNETKRPFVAGSTVLRTRAQGCNATMEVRAAFTDSVELFWINHGNDTLSATVSFGSGNIFDITKRFSPAERFVRLGAFPAGPGSNVTVTVQSTLPTDRAEGIIARALNAGYRAGSWNVEAGEVASFATNGWERTLHDLYLHADASANSIDILVDGEPIEARAIGEGTYLASDVVLRPGNHEIATSFEGEARVTAVPVGPSMPLRSVGTPKSQDKHRSWTFVAETDAPLLIAAKPGACAKPCHVTLSENGATIASEEALIDSNDDAVSILHPLFVAYPRPGTVYEITVDGSFRAPSAPIVIDLEESAVLFAAGQGTQRVSPSEAGNMYDVWARSLRPSTIAVSTPEGKRTLPENDGWTRVSTELLNDAGVEVTGGYVQLLAIPNTLVDAYHVPLSEQSPATIEGLPPGRYAVRSFGAGNPGTMAVELSGGRKVNASFRGDGGMYMSDARLAYDGTATASISTPWAQTLVLYEPFVATTGPAGTSTGSLLRLDDPPGDFALGTRAGESATYLFDARAAGVGPVTIATLGTAKADDIARTFAENALALLRRGAIIPAAGTCSLSKDPTCDPRRYVRAPSVFGSVDGTTGAVSYPEGRRLMGADTLTLDDAYALRASCAYCKVECIAGTAEGATCVRTNAVPWNSGGIVSVAGTGNIPVYTSPTEEKLSTLPSLFRSMRRDRLLANFPTYFEQPSPARDVTLTLGMFVSATEPNVLAANATISATHGAAAALRTPSARLAIGEAIGHAVAYAHDVERSDLAFVMRSPAGMDRLRRYLVDKGVRVVPAQTPEDDPLLLKAMQRLGLDGDAAVAPAWSNGRLTYVATLPADMEYPSIPPEVRTVKDALTLLAGRQETDIESLQRGAENGFINGKMLQLQIREILALPLDDSLRVKLEYLLRSR